MAKKYNKARAKKLASTHMENLEEQIAVQRFKDHNLAQKYFNIIRRLSRKFRLPISRTLKRQYCKHCHTLLTPGLNSRVRLRNGKRVVYCSVCKNYTRTNYSKK